jgi:hypothetical protein
MFFCFSIFLIQYARSESIGGKLYAFDRMMIVRGIVSKWTTAQLAALLNVVADFKKFRNFPAVSYWCGVVWQTKKGLPLTRLT